MTEGKIVVMVLLAPILFLVLLAYLWVLDAIARAIQKIIAWFR